MAERARGGLMRTIKGASERVKNIPAQGREARGGSSRKREEEKEEDDEREEKEERATEGKSRATCTRQQPPTSEELIINLLSPSPNAAVPLLRPPSLHFHLRLSLSPATLFHPLGPPSSLSLVLSPSPPFPFFPISPFLPRLLPASPLLSSPLLHPRCVVVCLRLRLLALSLSPLCLRGLAFDFRPRPIDLQTLPLLSVYLTHAGCDAQRHDA